MGSSTGESLISRVARLLEAFDRNGESMSLSTLANRAGLPVATAYRLVTELVRFGLLERLPNKDIRIGLHLWELSAQRNRGAAIREAALPFMIDLRAAIHEIVTVAVLDDRSTVFLERLAPLETTLLAGKMAHRHPVHASSSGLVLLAFAPADYQRIVLAGPLERLTRDTVTDPETLRRLLADIRRQHLACVAGLGTEGWSGMAVPVLGADGQADAALSIVYRRGTERPLEHTSALRAAAAGIRRVLDASKP